MTNRLITPLITFDDDRAYDIMRNCLIASLRDALDTADSHIRPWNPRDEIRDADDYITAATRIASRLADAMIDMTSPRDTLLDLLADPDFADDLCTADFSAELPAMTDFDFS